MAEADSTSRSAVVEGMIRNSSDENAGKKIAELHDFEQQRYGVQNYVVDYFKYRLEMDKKIWPDCPYIQFKDQEELEVMRSVVTIFEQKHAAELKNMIDALCRNKNLSFQRYVEVVENFGCGNDESAGQMSYGRLVALMAFGGLMAVHLAKIGMRQLITSVSMYTSKFLQKRILQSWEQDKRCWAQFFELAKKIIHLNLENKRKRDKSVGRLSAAGCWWPWISLAAISVLGIGMLALSRPKLFR